MTDPALRLRQSFAQSAVTVAPGCYDALTAALVERAGFTAAYLTGASIAYTRLGRPDIGLVSASEVVDVIGLIRDRCPDLPLIVDADTGFGNALNVQRTVRTFERAGASAIQLEDQVTPKRCGHLAGKKLVSVAEMVGKLKAAQDARRDQNTLIVARTDAIGVDGFEAAIDRAEAYVEAGADVLFIESPRDLNQMKCIASTFGSRIPLLANMVEGGVTPIVEADVLGDMGFRLVIFPGGIARVLIWTLEHFLADLKTNGSNAAWSERMHDFDGLNAAIGTEEMLAIGRRYDEGIAAAGFKVPAL